MKGDLELKHEVIIIGGGACGIMASIMAKDFGLDVALIEGGDRIGKKILTTGNGRCNITNNNINPIRYHSSNPPFIKYIIDKFTLEDTINFFKSLGLYLITLEENKLYPLSLQASSVLDIFRFNLEDRNTPIYLNSKVKNIIKIRDKNLFQINTEDGSIYYCKKILLCTGGKSYSKTGSDGSGYKIAEALGHNIVPTSPGLVQLKLKYDRLKALSGVKFNGNANMLVDGKLRRSEFGEILFTDYGISGPPILQLSRLASRALLENKPVLLEIDIMPNYDKAELIDFMEGHFALFSYRSIADNLVGILNKKLIPIILKESGIIDIHTPTYAIEYENRYKLYTLLKQWNFPVCGTNSFDNAQVTLGGVNTLEVNHCTLESKLVSGLYFGGEILDVDGDCGGFNLQWSWSSGAVAIKSIYESLRDL